MGELLDRSFLGNRVEDYLMAAGVFIVAVLALLILKRVVIRSLKKLAERTASDLDDRLVAVASRRIFPVLYFGAFYLSIRGLRLNASVVKVLAILWSALLTFYGVRFLNALTTYAIKSYCARREADEARQRAISGVASALNVVLWGLAVVLLLDNMGVRISALVAGLGIGGVAVALAAQAVLGDLFSYFIIFFDRPFEIGDYITVGEFMGTVEHIGIKTTRLRSLNGEQVIMANADLTGSRLRNYKRMERRRAVFQVRVTCDTRAELLRKIPGIIRAIIEDFADADFDRCHFASFGDYSLVFETVYYIKSGDYRRYMDIQQEINLRIKEEFERLGIRLAYPTQTIYHRALESE